MKVTSTIFLFLGLFSMSALKLCAQSVSVQGKITDNTDKKPVPGVSVQVKGTNTGTVSSIDGDYRISAPPSATLVFSIIGYKKTEVAVAGQKTINVILQADSKALNEVVVTAFGVKQEKKALGYASQDLKAEQIAESKQPNVINALQGRIAGATISSTGGAPGQGASIIIRGVNSLDPSKSNQPLIVLDGIPIDNSTSTVGGADSRGLSNRAADINPDDVESISVLKGGAATALYGLRGANGVLAITTKSASSGPLRITYGTSYSFDEVNKFPDVQTTYTQGYKGVYNAQDFWPSWGPTVDAARLIDPSHPAKLFKNYENAYGNGSVFRNNLSLSGGSENALFSASLSQLKQNGALPYSDYKNLSGRLSGELKFSDKFKTNAIVYFINSGGNRVNADRFNEQLIYWAPRYDVNDFLKADGTQQTYTAGTDNPVYQAYTNKYRDNVNRTISSINFTYDPVKWLSLSYRAGMDYYNDNRTATIPAPLGLTDEIPNGDAVLTNGLIGDYRTQYRAINSTFIANFKHDFLSKLHTDLKVGHDLYQYDNNTVSVEGTQLDVPTFFSMANAKQIVSNQSRSQYRIIGLFGALTLNWDDYLYLTLTGRNDWTSTLPKNNSFFYPSASLSYIFSENFKLPSFFSFGKLRFSYASIGKDALPYNTTQGYVPITQPIGEAIGWTRATSFGVENLKPEFTNTYEGGFELRFLQNRLGLDATYYYSKSRDLIFGVPISNATGYDQIFINAGELRNKGIELSLTGTPVKKNDFSWDVNVNFSANRNKVLSLNPALQEIVVLNQFGYLNASATQKYIPGQPVGSIFGSTYARQNQGTGIGYNKDLPMIIGSNGFPVRNPANDQRILGNSQPQWIGGINNSFRYKDFSLSFLFDIRQGQEKYNQFANFMAAFGTSEITENRNQTIVFPGVLANGQPNTKPVFLGQGVGPDGVDYGDGYYRLNYRGVTENFIENASWVRLRNVSFTYRLPQKFIERTKVIKNASITLTGNNLWLITDYTGFDPESSSFASGSNADGFAGFTYPALRSYIATLNVSF